MVINITGGEVLIDDEDYELVSQYKWHVGDTGYALWRGIENGIKKTLRMHRLIMNTPVGKITDHINHNRLDNRKSNLRIGSQSDNMRNKSDQGKGYWFQKQNNNWVVEIYGTHRGVFDTEQEAADFAELVRAGVVDKKPKIERTICSHGHSLHDAYDYGRGKMCRKCQAIRGKKYYRSKYANQN